MDIVLTDCQKDAIKKFTSFLLNPDATYFRLMGAAGSGKTFVLPHLIEQSNKTYKFFGEVNDLPPLYNYYCAPTHKAAQVFSETLQSAGFSANAKTVHNLFNLSLKKDYKTGKMRTVQKKAPTFIGFTKSLHVIFIDEASMVSEEMLYFAKKAIEAKKAHNGSIKLVFIGDPYQLPPVGDKVSPFLNLRLYSPDHEVFLSEVVRQDKDTNLAALVRAARKGVENPSKRLPEFSCAEPDVHVYRHDDQKEYFETLYKSFCNAKAPLNTRVLTYTNERAVDYVKGIFNYWKKSEDFSVGNVVINNNAIISESNNTVLCPANHLVKIMAMEDAEVYGVEGRMYTIRSISLLPSTTAARCKVFVPFCYTDKSDLLAKFSRKKDFTSYFRVKNSWGDFRHPHSMTVHKSQGSTYEKVFVDLFDFQKCVDFEVYRKLLYVAFSRASSEIHIFGSAK